MKIYKGFDSDEDTTDGCLIFANTIQEARRIALPALDELFYTEWWDVEIVEMMDSEYLRSQATSNLSHVVMRPRKCDLCDAWDEVLTNGRCSCCEQNTPWEFTIILPKNGKFNVHDSDSNNTTLFKISKDGDGRTYVTIDSPSGEVVFIEGGEA